MIILQILAAIMLLPLTLVALLLLNLYVRHFLYLLAVTLYGILYASLAGLVFMSINAGCWTMIILTVLYIIRINYIARRIRHKPEPASYPVVRGDIHFRQSGLRVIFYLAIVFIRAARYTPDFISCRMQRRAGLDMEIPQLIELILNAAIGTSVKVDSKEADIFFEIQ
ncbi:MAG TPA: hypothetical protein VKS21_00015 [Spirochaetota bacterium]|nr:hypothetical protein [Spirochaetota bacterium]